jgi:hypothetical protein
MYRPFVLAGVAVVLLALSGTSNHEASAQNIPKWLGKEAKQAARSVIEQAESAGVEHGLRYTTGVVVGKKESKPAPATIAAAMKLRDLQIDPRF